MLLWVIFATSLGFVAPQSSNLPPRFLPGGDMRGFTLKEDTPIGTSVYTLKGQDPEGTDVTFSISGDYLSVDRNTGVVSLVKNLDRETVSSIEIIITVTDSRIFGQDSNTVPIRLDIPILDVNDNRPMFKDSPYRFRVSERAALGATLFSDILVFDADAGTNSDIRLSCVREETPDACNIFNIREAKIEEGNYLGVISLSNHLDYEKRSRYRMKLRAVDGGGLSSSTIVDILVIDIQDHPPVLLNAPYSSTVLEGTPQGIEIIKILARDGDLSNPQPIKLSIEGDRKGYFTLQDIENHGDGSVSANLVTSTVPLDREDPAIMKNSGIYYFYIKAEEIKGNREWAHSKVAIVVSDRNDQIPTFSESEVNVTVAENIINDTPLPGLNVLVSDNDVGENSKISLHLENIPGGKDAKDVFEIFPKEVYGRAPIIVKVKNAAALDFENPLSKKYAFKVIAKQSGQIGSSVLVNVHVKDANDNRPEFKFNSYRYSVEESAKPGTPIATLMARDKDSGDYGNITYSVRGFGSEKFSVHPTSGIISVADCKLQSLTCLDFEQQSFYSLTYTATDGGGEIAVVSVIINVIDVNDNPPSFDAVEYRRVVDEGAIKFVPPFFVLATDVDGKEQGDGVVTYSIYDGNTNDQAFQINQKTGEINIKRPLTHVDTPSSIYTLTIRATDAGKPPLFTDVRALVRVGRDKNRPPRFLKQVYNANLKEHSAPGTSVLSVKARDPDGVDSSITYHFRSGGADHFDLNPKTGVITVASDVVLDRDIYGGFELIVTAVDSGQETQQSSTAIVNITLNDVNNKPPKFLKKSYIDYISERSNEDHFVLEVKASDPDLESRISYTIIEPIFAYDKTGFKLRENSPYKYKEAFRLDKTTGKVFVSGPLSHDAASVIVFTVMAVDENADSLYPLQNDTAEVTIYVQAFSNENPIFPEPWSPSNPYLMVTIKEESPLNEHLFSVAAEDPISKRTVRRYEKIKSSDPKDIFFVDPISGQVSLKKRIDYENSEDKEERFEVMAIAGDRTSQASVIVTLEDVNDHNPVFTEKEYYIRLKEDSKWPTPVAQISASDKDTGSNGEVSYKLTGEFRNMFTINSTTGLIQVAPNINLDREKTPTINLEVTAMDTPKGGASQRQTTVTVKIDLLDVNDEKPKWTNDASYVAVVPENSPIGTPVIKVKATDLDLAASGNVMYQIPELQQLDGFFKIGADSGIITVDALLSGKGRSSPYELTVRALDKGSPPQFSEALVNLYISDVSHNDGIPKFVFPGANETAHIMENSPIGTAVVQVRAIDPDRTDSPDGRISYAFLEDSLNKIPFKINPTTGLITTRGNLDREEVSEYRLVVLAKDMGRIPQVASRVLVINVTDADDNDPKFVKVMGKEWVEFEVEEEAASGTVVGRVQALDADVGVNALVDYKIIHGNDENLFSIKRTKDNKGEITVKGRIDREKVDEMELVVACGKLGQRLADRQPYKSADSTLLKVLVNVKDLDDNRPEFDKSQYFVGVKIDAPLLTQAATLSAVDKDPTSLPVRYSIYNASVAQLQENNQILFERSLNNTEVFLLEENTGILRTASPLNLYSGDVFILFVAATSNPIYKPTLVKITIYVLKDSEMLRFVFNKNPLRVRNMIPEFLREVHRALPVSDALNVYETNYYNDPNGIVDYGKTSSCFQLIGRNMKDTKKILDEERNAKLKNVFTQYGVERLEPCQPRILGAQIDWVEIWVLVIAAFIGIGALIASISVCLLYSSFKKRIERNIQHIRLLESPKSILGSPTPTPLVISPNLPPHHGSIVMLPSPNPGSENGILRPPASMEWQEIQSPMENGSYSMIRR